MSFLRSDIQINIKNSLWVAAITVILGGIRFSDGGIMLKIASWDGQSELALNQHLGEYILDSPLKFFLLNLVPPNIIFISFVFILLSFLPLAGLLAKKNRLLVYLTSIVILITPMIKISFQNVGVGDGVVFLLMILAVTANAGHWIALLFFLIGVWHPQQSFFIGGSYIIFNMMFRNKEFKKCLISAGLGLAAAFVIFLIYKGSVGAYWDRLQFLKLVMGPFLIKNLKLILLSLLPVILWAHLIKRLKPDLHTPWYAILWILLAVVIANLTTDVTRVFSTILLPMLLIAMKGRYLEAQEAHADNGFKIPFIYVLLSVVIPPVSWSGIDVFLWPSVFEDLCKYEVFCF